MTNEMRLEVTRRAGCEDLPLPQYMSEGAAGMDLVAAVEEPVTLAPSERALVPTGLHIAVPPGHEAQIRPRSGLAVKHGLSIVNAPGTVDSDYRGEVKVSLINLGAERFTVERGMRIAQMVIAPVTRAEVIEVRELSDTARGAGGFGSSGLGRGKA